VGWGGRCWRCRRRCTTCLRLAGLDSAHTRCPTPLDAIERNGACRTGFAVVNPLTIISARTAIEAGTTRVSSRFDMAGVLGERWVPA
jgi:hypothetical protein